MICISMTRDRDGEHFVFDDRQENPISALRMLVQSELAFGGSITEATGTRLTVATRVLACEDTTTFEGSAEEMRILNETAHFYLRACQDESTVQNGVLADLANLPDGQGGIPLIINMAAPMFMGRNRLALAMMLALGITEEQDISASMLMGTGDILAAYELMQEFPAMSLAELSAATSN